MYYFVYSGSRAIQRGSRTNQSSAARPASGRKLQGTTLSRPRWRYWIRSDFFYKFYTVHSLLVYLCNLYFNYAEICFPVLFKFSNASFFLKLFIPALWFHIPKYNIDRVLACFFGGTLLLKLLRKCKQQVCKCCLFISKCKVYILISTILHAITGMKDGERTA